MTITAPVRDPEQRLAALRRANQIRIDRARMKKQIKAGEIHVTDVLRDVPGHASSMKVYELLKSNPKFGTVKATRTLNQSRISQSKTVGGLSERQRGELITELS